MTEVVSPPNPQETEANLKTLLQEVNTWAGDLDAGTAVPVGVADIQRYQAAKIKFTDPTSNLTRLTPAMFEKVNVQLSPLHSEQMRRQFDFYYMTLSVQMKPEPGTYYRALGCQLNFGLDGAKNPIVVSIFPDTQWQEVFNFGGSLLLNLDGNLGFEVGVDTAVPQSALAALPANLQSKLVNQNAMKAAIQIPPFAYSRGRFNIAAYGPDGSECYWNLENEEISQTLTVQFTIVFKVPQGTQAFSLKGVAWAEPDMDKLTTNFRHVIRRFQTSLRDMFRGENKGAREFAITVGEQWDSIALPQPLIAEAAAPAAAPAAAASTDTIETAPLNPLQRASKMGKLLSEWFKESELRTICMDIGYDYENISGDTKLEKAQELALKTLRENKFDTLRAYCQKERPHVNWDI